jgi:hypothetical protein
VRQLSKTIPHSQIKQACLTDVLDLGTSGTDLGLLEPGSTTGVPTKDGEGSYTDLEVGRRQLATRPASLPFLCAPCIPFRTPACSVKQKR